MDVPNPHIEHIVVRYHQTAKLKNITMIERFIKWLDNYPEFQEGEVRAILDDAIRCYKFDIPRPALMLSYIAFMFAVRKNILVMDRPFGYTEGHWNNLMSELRSQNKADEAFITCITTKEDYEPKPNHDKLKRAAIFSIPDSLRNEVVYWKDRRNDCAHYKKGEVSLSHVSAFWQFMMSKYKFFFPGGTLAKSIEEYTRFFDPQYTAPNESDTDLFKRLVVSIVGKDDIRNLIIGLRDNHVNGQKAFDLFHRLYIGSNEVVHQAFDEFNKEHDDFALKVVRRYPDTIAMVYGNNPQKVRELWYNDDEMTIYTSLLEHRLIPDEQIEESFKRKLDAWEDRNSAPYINDKQHKVLSDSGFFDYFITYKYGLDNTTVRYERINGRIDFYGDLLMSCPMNEKTVQALVAVFTNNNYPYSLKSRLRDKFNRGELDKAKYLEIVQRLGLTECLGVS